MNKNIKRLTFAAVFVALAFVLNLFTIKVSDSLQLGIAELPIMTSGLFLGPIYGSIVGFVFDILKGYPISLFTLGPIALGLIPGLALKLFGREKLYSSILLLSLVVFSATLARTGINMLAIRYVHGLEWEAIFLTLPPKLLAVGVEGVIYIIVYRSLLPLLAKTFKDMID